MKAECVMCKYIETRKHLIYECKILLHIWRLFGEHNSFDIKCKHIIIGFYYENNRKTTTLNLGIP